MAETSFSVCLPGGDPFDVAVATEDHVQMLREAVGRVRNVPAGCHLKLFQDGQLLIDDAPVASLDPEQPLFAVITRETKLEVLLQQAGSFEGYKELLALASQVDGDSKCVAEVPTILQVLEEMSGEAKDVPGLKAGEASGTLQFEGESGVLLLPSLDAGPLLQAAGTESFASVTMTIEVNSDAWNRGLGVVVEAPSVMDHTVDERGLPSYIYNGYGLSGDKIQNAVKFHPGMGGGQIRIEGVGGWGNSNMGFTPLSWTESGKKFHTLELTMEPNGRNKLVVKGTGNGEMFQKTWTRKLTNGRHLPAIHAWLDLGGPRPLMVGKVGFNIQTKDGANILQRIQREVAEADGSILQRVQRIGANVCGAFQR